MKDLCHDRAIAGAAPTRSNIRNEVVAMSPQANDLLAMIALGIGGFALGIGGFVVICLSHWR